ncbi:beta-lactamase/transpeptidase-like protein [Mycena pura]|uniref:Beta-lactamase/transpeptidase-like protein n=1 Tax=Mycena pura TaxID=153505 RepID=A0AAD6YE00_9AGAR|nr:beta-lactamase/transpeptidase-like protein [Mycena pura]
MVSPSTQEKLDQILSEAVASKSSPALFLAVSDADGPVYSRQVGTRHFDDPSSGLIDEDTVFWLCSQTKLITSIAALQLVEQGKITLDTAVSEVLPELANPVVVTGYDDAGKPATSTPATAQITLGQLLNHTSGLSYALNGMITTGPSAGLPLACMHNYKGKDVSAFFKILKGDLPGVPVQFEPGSNFVYGFSTDCVGFIVERLSGKSLEQYFQEHIFAPLGITSLSFYLTPSLRERLLPFTFRRQDGTLERVDAPPGIDLDSAKAVHLGGIGLYGSQKDYLAVLRHLLQIKSGRAVEYPILSRTSVEALFTPTLPPAAAATMDVVVKFLFPHLDIPAGAAQFSSGLLVNTVNVLGKRSAGSGAWAGWANTNHFVDPVRGVAVVFGTQLSPAVDDALMRLWSRLEKELYAANDAA